MRNMKKLWIISFVFCTAQVGLWGIAKFDLPAGTPGRQQDATGAPILADVAGKRYEHVVIPGTTCRLYFPDDGSQPDTTHAGLWSGARYLGLDNNLVTDWWVRVFGGRQAVGFSRDGGDPYFDPEMGFDTENNSLRIIRVKAKSADTPSDFEKQFWQTFRTIASDPVGRVLLYRILIEIRRIDDHGNGCCENGDYRSKVRTIGIKNGDFLFSWYWSHINFDLRNKQMIILYFNGTHIVTLKEANTPKDVSLFHEMVHWFHHLRNHERVENNRKVRGFRRVIRSYYGDLGELSFWGVTFDEEEIATILGAPNYNKACHLAYMKADTFLLPFAKPLGRSISVTNKGITTYIPFTERFSNGDDLSENAYRCSKKLPMRWGHTSLERFHIDLLQLPLQYQLAHKVATDCYAEISGQQPINWRLQPGMAILK